MNNFRLKAIQLIALSLLALPALLIARPQQGGQAAKAAPASASKAAPSGEQGNTWVGLDSSQVRHGSRQAPITIEVFSDYQCPQCRIFYQDTARQLMDSYIPQGQGLLRSSRLSSLHALSFS